MKTYKGLIGKPTNPNQILVGGTNPQGRHGAGVALLGLQYWGAIYGVGYGLQGQFYGIVTKDLRLLTHPSIGQGHIIDQISSLGKFARSLYYVNKEFLIAYSGNGKNLNGYSAQEMANMFKEGLVIIPKNIVFEEGFAKLMQ